MSVGELACSYAALILHDDGIPITGEKLATLVKAAGVTVESYWPALFAKLLEKRSVEDLITNVGSGGGGAVAVSSGAPAAGAAPAVVEKEEEKKVSFNQPFKPNQVQAKLKDTKEQFAKHLCTIDAIQIQVVDIVVLQKLNAWH